MFESGHVAQKASDSQSVLGRAFLKYADALTLDNTKAEYHFHVGRLLIAQADYSSAIGRLETALNCNLRHELARSVTVCYISTSQHSYTVHSHMCMSNVHCTTVDSVDWMSM